MRKLSAQTIKILLIRFAGTFGSGMLSFAIGLYILRRTGSALGMGISLITGPLVSLCLTPVLGYIVDTMNHRAIMVLAQLGTSLGLITFAVAFHVAPAAYYQELIALIILLQITDSFLSTTLTASLVQLFAKSELQAVNSLNQSLQSLAGFLAPIVGALVYTLVSIGSFALIEVGFELIALGGILALRFSPKAETAATAAIVDAEATAPASATAGPDAAIVDTTTAAAATVDAANPATEGATTAAPAADAATPAKSSLWHNFAEGFRFLVSQPLFLIMMATGAAINFFFAALNVGLPYLLVQTLRLSNTQYGWTDSAFAVGMFLGGLLLSQIKLRWHPIYVSYVFLIALAGLLVAVGLPTLTGWSNGVNTAFYIALNILQGVALVFINTPINTFMMQLIPENMQGRVFSLQSAVSTMLMPLGTLLYGVMFDHLSGLWIFTVTGILVAGLVLAAMATIRGRRMLDGLPTFDSDEPTQAA